MSCPDCFTGTVHEGTPKGHVATLHGLPTYISEPDIPKDQIKGVVVIIPDAFGWEFVNNRILADHYADMGKFRVYLPDFMQGNAAPVWSIETIRAVTKTGSLWDWISKPYHISLLLYGVLPFLISNRFPKSYPRVKAFFSALRHSEQDGLLPIGAAGFCWGGKHTLLLARGTARTSITDSNGASKEIPLIDAGFTGHPSMLDIPGDVEKVTLPVSFALAELDTAVPKKDIESIQGVMSKKEELGGEVRVYLNAGHGFCVRADMAVEESDRQCREAEEQAVGFFQRCFARL